MKNPIVVYTGRMARKLLREGYTIGDIKADQTDPDRKRSIFFFKNEDGILDMVKKICKEK